jgi:hypothetical protein
MLRTTVPRSVLVTVILAPETAALDVENGAEYGPGDVVGPNLTTGYRKR